MDVQSYLGDVAASWRPPTVSMRYRALQQLFKWLVEEEEIERFPMERMQRPQVPEQPVEVIHSEQARRLVYELLTRHVLQVHAQRVRDRTATASLFCDAT